MRLPSQLYCGIGPPSQLYRGIGPPSPGGGRMTRVLVAGVGNVFCGDDGFGVAVVDRLSRERLPDGVEVCDYGIRGVHLAYQMLDPYDLVVLVDTMRRGGEPGTVYVVEPEPPAEPEPGPGSGTAGAEVLMDAHDMTPDAILALVPKLGGTVGDVLVVGCEPGDLGPGMELSGPVARSVDDAVGVVKRLVGTVTAGAGAVGTS
jgi:hydrogenase maturation protease